MIGGERLVGLDRSQLQSHALWVGEAKPKTVELGVDALVGEPVHPERERLLGRHSEGDPVHHPGAGLPAREARVLEEGDVGAGLPCSSA